ncbi:hypothetical protein [Cloacibacillus porcorum]
MNNKKLAAFTLVEALIGVIIMMIVIGGIALSIKMGIDMYGRAEAHSELINGMRFTLDSFNREISPMLSSTKEIEILSYDNADIPAVLSDDVHYLYLRDGALTHRSKDGEEPLTGSEYISQVLFSIPSAVDEKGENYTLAMKLIAQHTRYGAVHYKTGVDKALYNRPDKLGLTEGTILRFKFNEDEMLNVLVENIRLYDGAKDISNSTNVSKGTEVTASYDLKVEGTDIADYEDTSIVEWYIAANVIDSINISNEPPGTQNINECHWQLVDSSGTPLTGKTLNTSEDFYLKHGDSVTKWSYGVVRCRVTPQISDTAKNIVGTGEPAWGPYAVIIEKKDSNKGGKLWPEWFEHLSNGGQTDDFIENTKDVTIGVSTETGKKIVTLNPGSSNSGSAILADVRLSLMGDERFYSRGEHGYETMAITSITNYSIIVDAEIVDTSGYGILLNGRVAYSNKTPKDYGYMFQYDQARKTFLIRLFGNSQQAQKGNPDFVDLFGEQEALYGAYPERALADNNGIALKDANHANSEYIIRGMQNDKFRLKDESATYYKERKRVLYTILEYYYANEDKTKPHYILRMRTLKDTDTELNKMSPARRSEVVKNDPWFIGADFYDSEPIWFGDFVGSPEEKSGDIYINTVKNFSKDLNNTKIETADYKKNRYPMAVHDEKSSKNAYAIYRGYDLNVWKDLRAKWGKEPWTSDQNLQETYAADGKRYIGVRVWGSNTTTTGVRFYEINIAPGFSIDELRAIMPKGGLLYQVEETYNMGDWNKLNDADRDKMFNWQKNHDGALNKIFAGDEIAGGGNKASDGKGNNSKSGKVGVGDIQHVPGNCTCSMWHGK